MHKKTKSTKPDYNTSSHCKYLIQYHIIWCPKFRFPILRNNVANNLKVILSDICDKYHYQIKAMEVMEDHIHLFISAPQTTAPSDIVRTLKSISAIKMFQLYPELKLFYAKAGCLWAGGYFISTIGEVSAETIKHYIENQH